MELRRNEHPGKFEHCLIVDEAIYDHSLNGCDEKESDEDGGEWYGLMRGPIIATADEGRSLNWDEIHYLGSIAGGFIVYQSSDGFITVDHYETATELETAWSRVVDSFADAREASEDAESYQDDDSSDDED